MPVDFRPLNAICICGDAGLLRPPWHSVNDLLPLWEDRDWYHSRNVLIWGKALGFRIAYLDCSDLERVEWRLVDSDGWSYSIESFEILFWQELPAPPQGA